MPALPAKGKRNLPAQQPASDGGCDRKNLLGRYYLVAVSLTWVVLGSAARSNSAQGTNSPLGHNTGPEKFKWKARSTLKPNGHRSLPRDRGELHQDKKGVRTIYEIVLTPFQFPTGKSSHQ